MLVQRWDRAAVGAGMHTAVLGTVDSHVRLPSLEGAGHALFPGPTTCRRPRVGIQCRRLNRPPALFARWQISGPDTPSPGSAFVVRPVRLGPTVMTSGKGAATLGITRHPSPGAEGLLPAGAKPFGGALRAQMQLAAACAASALALVGFRDDSHSGLAEGPHSTIHVTGDLRGLIPDGAATKPAVELGCGDGP